MTLARHKAGTWQHSKIRTFSCWWMDIQRFSPRNSNFNLNYSTFSVESLILPLSWGIVGLESAVLPKQVFDAGFDRKCWMDTSLHNIIQWFFPHLLYKVRNLSKIIPKVFSWFAILIFFSFLYHLFTSSFLKAGTFLRSSPPHDSKNSDSLKQQN